MSDEWINDVAIIATSKAGHPYVKFNKDVNLKEGDRLLMKKKSDDLDEQIASGKITEERGQVLKEKLSFIKYTLTKPPRDKK